jgi:hypothetical protein
MIELPPQNVAAFADPPDFEEWKKRVRSASDEELKHLQIGAHAGLRGEFPNQRWSPYIGVVEEEMRHRGIKP